MPCVSLQRKLPKFQEESSDLETQLLELGFLCENKNEVGQTAASFAYNAHGSGIRTRKVVEKNGVIPPP